MIYTKISKPLRRTDFEEKSPLATRSCSYLLRVGANDDFNQNMQPHLLKIFLKNPLSFSS